jgi:hypothetical protein
LPPNDGGEDPIAAAPIKFSLLGRLDKPLRQTLDPWLTIRDAIGQPLGAPRPLE